MKAILNLLGIAVVLGILWLISWKRKDVSFKMLLKGVIKPVYHSFNTCKNSSR